MHGHYADAGEVAALMSSTLGVDMVMTGHSLGRNKLEHLLGAPLARSPLQSLRQAARVFLAESASAVSQLQCCCCHHSILCMLASAAACQGHQPLYCPSASRVDSNAWQPAYPSCSIYRWQGQVANMPLFMQAWLITYRHAVANVCNHASCCRGHMHILLNLCGLRRQAR